MRKSCLFSLTAFGLVFRGLNGFYDDRLGFYYCYRTLLQKQLWEQDGLVQSELAQGLRVGPPTPTKMLHRLEKVGLVKRRKDPEDARIRRVYLTDSGRSLQEPVTRYWKHFEEKILSELTLEEQLLFRRLLLQVYSNLTNT